MGSTIEYYRPKYLKGFSVTITLFVKPHQRAGVTWRDSPGIDGKSIALEPMEKKGEEEKYLMFDLPIGGYIMITAGDDTKRSYIQLNQYNATEDGLIFNEDRSENLFTFIPIDLINLEKTA